MRTFSKSAILRKVEAALGAQALAVVVADAVHVHEDQGAEYVRSVVETLHEALADALAPLPCEVVLTLAMQAVVVAEVAEVPEIVETPEAEDVEAEPEPEPEAPSPAWPTRGPGQRGA